MKTWEEIRSMTSEEIKSRLDELSDILQFGCFGDNWDEAYKEYSRYSAVLDERYREENQSAFDAFYKEHIEGKAWEEIDGDTWQTYSDWHKDMYGFRPKHI
jgi:hypothetical protein